MACKSSEESHPLDIALGSRIRLCRKDRDLSQSELAGLIGLTFQQVQKYETGNNRVSFSRLVEIAEALACSVADLISGLDSSKSSDARSKYIALLATTGANDLIKAYVGIVSLRHRQVILNLARQLASDHAQATSPGRRRALKSDAKLARRARRA
jgi:transcriptional regulator with XRE-family HTH domain